MLREVDDRDPRPRKPVVWSAEFWLGVASMMILLALFAGFGSALFG